MTAPTGDERHDQFEDDLVQLMNEAYSDGLTLEQIDESFAEMHMLVEMSQHIIKLEAREATMGLMQ